MSGAEGELEPAPAALGAPKARKAGAGWAQIAFTSAVLVLGGAALSLYSFFVGSMSVMATDHCSIASGSEACDWDAFTRGWFAVTFSGAAAMLVAAAGVVVCLVKKWQLWYWPMAMVAIWYALFALGWSWEAAGVPSAR
ncbi:hypothetical protein [Segniliparus rugosus]|uniref:Uncharacterized protein n=1 Tax=Segniliparus rugosus (strain ATCC BAA-974 / DSM 45345 / CCUG 50838 / CIP 108380 / JCM 13579 / CDC 945) TaxID=679197 RepID=E5XLW0_SEGRC|nr:hypothetical protein [Segniliparus rugosus]EFV14646.1 hypothetical protein HMPREF9336_00479 [Segniliparus rugosus ATCC BAA-974]